MEFGKPRENRGLVSGTRYAELNATISCTRCLQRTEAGWPLHLATVLTGKGLLDGGRGEESSQILADSPYRPWVQLSRRVLWGCSTREHRLTDALHVAVCTRTSHGRACAECLAVGRDAV
jgi:hypothetical protein